MATLRIDGISDGLLDQLRRSASTNGRTLNGEVIARLETSFGLRRLDAETFLARLDALHRRITLPPLTDEVLDQAINDGRP